MSVRAVNLWVYFEAEDGFYHFTDFSKSTARVLLSSHWKCLYLLTLRAKGQEFDLGKPISISHLFESLPEFSSWGHSQLFCDVSRHFQKQHLHQSRHDSILEKKKKRKTLKRNTNILRGFLRITHCSVMKTLNILVKNRHWSYFLEQIHWSISLFCFSFYQL